jgi:predicted Zn-dependent protease
MLTQPEVRRLHDRVLTLVRATKGAEALVAVRSAREGNTRFALNEISTSGEVERLSITLTVQFGQRSASAVTNQLDDRAIDDLVGRVIRMARLAPENPEQMAVLGRQSYLAGKGAVDPATARLAPELRAKAIGAAIAAGDAAKVQIAGFFSHGSQAVALASSAGMSAYHEATRCGFSCTARTADGTGSGWAGAGSNRFAELDVPALAGIAVDKATSSAKPKKLEPGRYTVILEPAAVASLLGFFTGALDARRADEGRSFFSKNPPGKKLFPLAYTRYWARKQGKPPTGLPDGVTLDGGAATRDELIKGVQRGVLITRFWYLRPIDRQSLMITGLTRDGVYLIENGAITHPVNNFRFNESPVQMLAKCDGLGTTTIPTGSENDGVRVPILRTHEFNLASISDAV